MLRIKRQVRIAIILILLLATGAYMYLSRNNHSKYEYSFKEQVPVSTMMTVEQMKGDLDYLVSTLREVHPKTYHGFSDEQNLIIEEAYKKIQQPMEAGDFYFVLNEVICSLKDAHTSIIYDVNKKDRAIDLPIVWLSDGMYIQGNGEQVQKGDKVLTIGEKKVANLLVELEKITPAENQQWVRVRRTHDITKEPFLNYLGVVEDDYVPVTIERNGKVLNLKVPLEKDIKNEGNKNEVWVRYWIDDENSLGIFKLDTCVNNEEYKQTLASFFTAVSEHSIKNIVIDIRENTGGNSMVVNEFLRYIDIDEYVDYTGDVRYSKQAREQRGHPKKNGYKSYPKRTTNNKKVENSDLVFDGDLFALTSPYTFSSGNWFAVIMKDNNIGKVIGEPTGNQPSSYGDILMFQVPNAGFRFNVSYKKWVRPKVENDPENCLNPDIEVYTTIEDIVNRRDPQMEKLIEVINKTR